VFLVLVILVVCIAAFCIRVFIKAKSRIHFADTRHAMREFEKGNSQPPSWSLDKTRTQEFLYVVRKLATRKGVPEDFASKAVLALTNASVALVHYTGTVEAQGASFDSQKVAAADFLYTLWNNASPAERMVLLAAPGEGVYREDTDKASVRQRSVLDELQDMTVELLSNCAIDDSSKKFVDSYYESVDLALKQGNKKTLAIPSWTKREGELKLFLSCVTEKASRQGVAFSSKVILSAFFLFSSSKLRQASLTYSAQIPICFTKSNPWLSAWATQSRIKLRKSLLWNIKITYVLATP